MRHMIWIALCLTMAGFQTATAQDYWRCDSGKWIAEGQPGFPAPTRPCDGDPAPLPETKAECLAIGGSWDRYGIRPNETCLAPTADAGRICGDSAECEGMCLTELTPEQQSRLGSGGPVLATGQCAAFRPSYGCLTIVGEGAVRGTLCVD